MSTKHDTPIFFSPSFCRLGRGAAAGLLGADARSPGRTSSRTFASRCTPLERKIDALEQKAAIGDAAAKTASQVTANDKGYSARIRDGASSLKLRGLLQLDSRVFSGDSGLVNNSFVLRRARLFFEGSLARNVSFQLVPEFAVAPASAATVPSILDANFVFTVDQKFQLRPANSNPRSGWRCSSPSRPLPSSSARSLPNLVPNRDLRHSGRWGVAERHGQLHRRLFNGVPGWRQLDQCRLRQ